MKYLLLIMCLSASITSIFSQSNTVASGGNATGTTGSVSYGIGQIDYINSSSSTGSFNQGVQQPFELFLLNTLSNQLDISVSIGPNPSEGTFMLLVEGLQEGKILMSVTDLNGKLIIASKPLESSQIIDLQKESAGQYMLNLHSDNQLIGSYKLIKHR